MKEKFTLLIDWIMEKAYRFYLIFLSCVLVFTVCTGCFRSPIMAHAANPIEERIKEWLEALENNSKAVESAIQNDIRAGRLDATSEIYNQAMQWMAYQRLFYKDNAFAYRQFMIDNNWDELPLEFIGTYSGASGLYTSDIDNKIHIVSISTISESGQTLVSSDEIDLTVTFTGSDDQLETLKLAPYSNSNAMGQRMGFYIAKQAYSVSRVVSDSKGYFEPYTYKFSSNTGQGLAVYFTVELNNSYTIPPTISRRLFAVNNSILNRVVGSSGVLFEETTFNYDSDAPWDYYNDVMLPYARSHFPDVPDNYYFFPNGYGVPPLPDPTEPATYPQGGFIPDIDVDIDITVIYPTDENGEPVTDEEGETVTETQIVSDTRPTDAVYRFTIPTLPQLETVDNALPLEQSLPEHYASLIAGFFYLIDGLLTDSGIKPALPFMFTLGILTFAIYKVAS